MSGTRWQPTPDKKRQFPIRVIGVIRGYLILQRYSRQRLSSAEKTAFVGLWINDESETCEFRLTRDDELVGGELIWDDETQRHIARNYVIDARKTGDAVYFLVHDDPGDIGFVRIKRTDETRFVMYAPDPKKFRRAVENGVLEGEIIPRKNDNYTVRIHVDSPLTNQVFATADFHDWSLEDGTQSFRSIKRFDAAQ